MARIEKIVHIYCMQHERFTICNMKGFTVCNMKMKRKGRENDKNYKGEKRHK